jgi:hypothetical protein
MRVFIALIALGAAACAPTITPHSVTNQPQGLTKTVNVRVTPYFTATGAPRATYDIGGGPVTRTAVNANGLWSAEMPGSEALAQGTPVAVEWSLTYTPLLLPAPGTVTEPQSFTVGAPPRVDIQANRVCMRRGDLAEVELALTPAPLTAQVSLEVTPASLAVPQVTPITVTSPPGNAVNLSGQQIGEGALRATAQNFQPDEVPVEVIAPLATPVLSVPQNGASDVFSGSQPNPNASTVFVQLEWNAVPGAISGSQKYRVHWSENGGPWTFTNASAEFVGLSFPPGTEVAWKISARFDACPSGTTLGPESEVRSFTVWSPPQS